MNILTTSSTLPNYKAFGPGLIEEAKASMVADGFNSLHTAEEIETELLERVRVLFDDLADFF